MKVCISLGNLLRPHYDLTGILVSKGNHFQIALFQVSEILEFTQVGKATGEWRVNRKLSSKRRILQITLIPCHGR